MGRIFFAHPKQSWDTERIAAASRFLEEATGYEVINGREAFSLYFSSCRRNWGVWARKMGAGTKPDGQPLFDLIVVPGAMVARATSQIVEHAINAGRDVLVWRDATEAFNGPGEGFSRATGVVDEQPSNKFFGWRITV